MDANTDCSFAHPGFRFGDSDGFKKNWTSKWSVAANDYQILSQL
jgi:hypothetical protein